MRVLVMGGTGMLGHKMVEVLRERFRVLYTQRDAVGVAPGVGPVHAGHLRTVTAALDQARPDVVVNCIGIVKQRLCDPGEMIGVNAAFPHRLHALCARHGARLIHISTDCVFSGARGNYTEEDTPDPTDLYGRSKLYGEVGAPALTLRTSIIGPELGRAHGLLEWFRSQTGTVQGYTRAIFSGLTTLALSRLVGEIIERHRSLAGIYHVSASPISKYDLLVLLRDAYGLDVEVIPCPEPVIDRSLVSSKFRAATGWVPQSWPEMVHEMAQEAVPC